MSNKTEQLRSLPAVDEVLRADELADLLDQSPRRQLVRWIREAVEDCRRRILDGQPLQHGVMAAVVDRVRHLRQCEAGQTLQQVINATGVLLHTNLGRAPLADRAIERMNQAVGYANVELDLTAGRRSKRGQRAARLLAELSGAEDAVVVNNCASATMLVLQTIAGNREVVVSRGQLVEIGGGFRLPDVFTAAGVILREVGTTNRTYLRDYENAVGETTGAIIRVHRSNFKQSGFVTEPSIEELVAAQRPDHVPVIDDLGSGCFDDLSALGLDEPTVPHSVAAGADLTLFSGDKLFGGPQCGIIVGRSHWLSKLRRSPIMRAVRVDKLTLAALEATAEIHLAGNAVEELPLQRMMFRDPADIRADCLAVCERLAGFQAAKVCVVDCESQIGGGAIPGAALASHGVKISGVKIDELSLRLRTGQPAIQSRVAQDSLVLDLRTVAPQELQPLVSRLRQVLATFSERV